MKRLVFIFAFLLCCSAIQANARGIMTMAGAGVPSAACADSTCSAFSGLWCQNFETPTTGYDNSESWSTSGTVDPVYTTIKLRGNQSCALADGSSIIQSVTTDGEVYAFARFQFADATPSSATIIWKAVNGASDVGSIMLLTNGKLACIHGAGNHTASTALSDATTYYIWITHDVMSGAGANDGIMKAEVSTTRFRADINPNLSCSFTSGTDADLDVTAIRYMNSGTGGVVIDQLLGKTTSIGDVCE